MKALSKIGKVIFHSILKPSFRTVSIRFYVLSLMTIMLIYKDQTPQILKYFGEFGVLVKNILILYFVWLITIMPTLYIMELIDKKDEQR